ncbi:hypothetical protein ACJX0J_021252, partial [Zea mays]
KQIVVVCQKLGCLLPVWMYEIILFALKNKDVVCRVVFMHVSNNNFLMQLDDMIGY